MNDVLTIEHDEKVGDVLKKIRLDQGKTRLDIVNACDISLNTVALVENNKVIPSIPTLHEWCKALGYGSLCMKFHFESGDNQ